MGCSNKFTGTTKVKLNVLNSCPKNRQKNSMMHTPTPHPPNKGKKEKEVATNCNSEANVFYANIILRLHINAHATKKACKEANL